MIKKLNNEFDNNILNKLDILDKIELLSITKHTVTELGAYSYYKDNEIIIDAISAKHNMVIIKEGHLTQRYQSLLITKAKYVRILNSSLENALCHDFVEKNINKSLEFIYIGIQCKKPLYVDCFSNIINLNLLNKHKYIDTLFYIDYEKLFKLIVDSDKYIESTFDNKSDTDTYSFSEYIDMTKPF